MKNVSLQRREERKEKDKFFHLPLRRQQIKTLSRFAARLYCGWHLKYLKPYSDAPQGLDLGRVLDTCPVEF